MFLFLSGIASEYIKQKLGDLLRENNKLKSSLLEFKDQEEKKHTRFEKHN